MKKRKWGGNIYLLILFAILYMPIVYLIVYSFNSTDTMNEFTGFSLQWFTELFKDERLLQSVLNTIVIGLLSALIATVIGVIAAIGLYNMRQKRAREGMLAINNILITSPDVIIGASFLMLFTMIGMSLGFVSVLIAHIAFSVPLVVLMVLPKLNEMNTNLIDAAYDLGASRFYALRAVILPQIMGGVFAGFFTALTYSLDDFAVTFFVTGNGFSTLSIEVYSMARMGISLKINAISTVIFVIVFVGVLVQYSYQQQKLKRKEERRHA